MKPMTVTEYIENNFERSIYKDAGGSGFRGIDLPHPYTSPCIKGEGKFYFFFYWDTAFTNLGLLLTGRTATAKDNIRNMLWLIDRYGYMPNHVGITNRSQPPFLAMMVEHYFDAVGGPGADPDFHRACAEGLRREYFFWTLARHTPTGLQRHGEHETDEGRAAFYHNKRVLAQGYSADAPPEDQRRVGAHFLAEAETGWDFNQRFHARCLDHNPVDLNALLATYETFLMKASKSLGWGDHQLWEERAAARRSRVHDLLWNDEEGGFFDYDFVRRQSSDVLSLAAMLPMVTGLASPSQAARMVDRLPELEGPHGIAVTHERPGCRNYQWAFPNAWPPLTWLTVEGLRRYGFHEAARRIAEKYVATTERLFAKTGQLWEKTDVITGEVAGGEYDAAPMIGWSAGVYLALLDFRQNRTADPRSPS